MRLSRVKLAGFKSFVDPTSIALPSNLVGVVGPNGCGKSNVIDAVRWVMGESSAKHLRGDSMEDVIFSGSRARQPVGQASVELIFDNSDGTVGGEYAGYAEISVKRQVSREGQSVYSLNGTRCRRRDITDIFLGTGLGPRSYAIIEQGMISGLIEARPEDMRVYIEEAAGISKYKDRRRETENRIRHTRDNLDRLNDLREEVEKQIGHLKRQARAAERFKELKNEERRLEAELLALRRAHHATALAEKDRQLQARETEYQRRVAEQREAENKIEKLRETHVQVNEAFNAVQGEFYKQGADISRSEQAIQHLRETRQRHQTELAELEVNWKEANQLIEHDQEKIRTLSASIEGDTPDYERLVGEQQSAAAVLHNAEQSMAEWQNNWDDFNRRNAEPLQIAQVERSRVEQFDKHLIQIQQRAGQQRNSLEQIGQDNLGSQIEALIHQEADAAGAEEQLQSRLAEQSAKVTQVRDTLNQVQSDLDELRNYQHTTQGRLASLEALQEAAMGEHAGAASGWLEQQGLEERPRLAQQITVDNGWELAVETVLEGYLEAVCVADLPGDFTGFEDGRMAFLDGADAPRRENSGETRLARYIQAAVPLPDTLDSVLTADDYAAALAQRAHLSDGESVITRDGIWLGRNWVRINRGQAGEASVLAREQEIKSLRGGLEDLTRKLEGVEKRREDLQRELQETEAQRDASQTTLNKSHAELVSTRSQLEAVRLRQEQTTQERSRLHEEINDLDRQAEQYQNESRASAERRARAMEDIENLAQERETLAALRDQLRDGLETARSQARESSAQGQELAVRVESMRSTRDATRQNLARVEAQLETLKSRRETLLQAQREGEAPIAAEQEALETLLKQRVEIERKLGESRSEVETVEGNLRGEEQNRVRAEQASQEVRENLEQQRLARQEDSVRVSTLDEQIAETQFSYKELAENLPEESNVEAWQERVQAIAARINRLGPINLAAIEEHAEQESRKEYLDKQYTDVTEALATLEAAIEKIDKETRSRFKETFERVNSKLQDYFPQLFGGGQANLVMTGSDLLNTGVSILARPPGKRVSNIHLLSGGEKALTAVALVFAFFELNPAPFCMLDEVDAPLDDANVGRYCELVREMSERVQFIFITHNKTTMELSDHLMGVTMQEPGVSRLVSVDVAEASRLAEA